MSDALTLRDDEAFVVPVDAERGIVFCANTDPTVLGEPVDVSPSLVNRFLEAASYGLVGDAPQRLTDGSLVRLAPETMMQLAADLEFVDDAKGYALGMMRVKDGSTFKAQARFITDAGNPIAASMLLQTMIVQRQLHSIEQALQQIDRKIDELGKAQRVGVLAEILALGTPISERSKSDANIALTAEDENRLGALEHQARTLNRQARLWLEHLRPLADGERLSLRTQHDMLVRAVGSEHVAFWVRAGIASDVALAQIRFLRCQRAAVANDPAWAQTFNAMVAAEVGELGDRQFDLHEQLTRYLRDRDIARGLEELSFSRKHEVQDRRRELMDVANTLRDGLLATSSLFGDASEQTRVVADALTPQDIEPPSLFDKLRGGAQEAARTAATGASAAGRVLDDGSAAAGRALGSGADTARSAAVRAAEEARRRLRR